MSRRDTPRTGVHVIADEVPEGVVPPSTSTAVPPLATGECSRRSTRAPIGMLELLHTRERALKGDGTAEDAQKLEQVLAEALDQVRSLIDVVEGKDEVLAVLPDLIRVAAYVSRGRGFVDIEPYPDALARKALGALDDTTIRAALDQPPKETHA